ncbi:hypothetical protein ASPWEDRAFT_432400 [Aspergillus wentii DTO 134E9]|uniref:Uncharacterized protein n=1 Tax=Aspergillus wentii DTO 134E9 TaxID=1073089 RepID=A0A1L9RPK5_ASPWE|nr:uncharacterized protein ASPWEDRAFT_432400 [Aspergillus wentii DTO 134E9]OJJ36885.1 hypothetical protein ASPWEDRAFT_432400 [Aspergillus wentii DTO 134E9]
MFCSILPPRLSLSPIGKCTRHRLHPICISPFHPTITHFSSPILPFQSRFLPLLTLSGVAVITIAFLLLLRHHPFNHVSLIYQLPELLF